MKHINKLSFILSRAVEFLHWLGVAATAILFIGTFLADSQTIRNLMTLCSQTAEFSYTPSISVYGFEWMSPITDFDAALIKFRFFAIVAIIFLSLMAMVFRNIALILKIIEGKSRHTDSNTPFQSDIIRMLREIGIFLILIPVIGLIMSVIIRLVFGADNVEISMRLDNILIGILVLSLSRIFSYGTELQKDVDGLL